MFNFDAIWQSVLAAVVEALSGSLLEAISGLFGGIVG